jgi:hypothetical protein
LGSFSQVGGEDSAWNKVSWDLALELVLKVVHASSLSLALELRSEFSNPVGKLGLDLVSLEGLRALLGEVVAQAKLEFELDLDDDAKLDAAVELVSWSWKRAWSTSAWASGASRCGRWEASFGRNTCFDDWSTSGFCVRSDLSRRSFTSERASLSDCGSTASWD